MAAKTFRELTTDTAPAATRILATQAPDGSAEPTKSTLTQTFDALLLSADANNTLTAAPKFWVGEEADLPDPQAVNTLYFELAPA